MTPPSYASDPARRFPVLYFLHDGRGDESVFFGQGLADALEKDMREGRLPEMLVVVPRGVGTWFVDAQGGVSRYATFLTGTLVPFVDARYRTVASRGARLVAGISMGGYGALRWAFAEPALFCAAGGLSPAIEQMCWPAVQGDALLHPALAREARSAADPVKNVLRQNDLYAMLLDDPLLAARVPFLHVRCGTEDKYRLAEIASFLDRYLDAFRHSPFRRPGNRSARLAVLETSVSRIRAHAFDPPFSAGGDAMSAASAPPGAVAARSASSCSTSTARCSRPGPPRARRSRPRSRTSTARAGTSTATPSKGASIPSS